MWSAIFPQEISPIFIKGLIKINLTCCHPHLSVSPRFSCPRLTVDPLPEKDDYSCFLNRIFFSPFSSLTADESPSIHKKTSSSTYIHSAGDFFPLRWKCWLHIAIFLLLLAWLTPFLLLNSHDTSVITTSFCLVFFVLFFCLRNAASRRSIRALQSPTLRCFQVLWIGSGFLTACQCWSSRHQMPSSSYHSSFVPQSLPMRLRLSQQGGKNVKILV